MAFKGDAEMQFQRQFYKLIPHSVIFVLNWTEVSHLLGGEKGCSNLKSGPSHFWQTSFAYSGNGKAGPLVKPEISGRLHLPIQVMTKLGLWLNLRLPHPPCQRCVTVGQSSNGLGKL